MAGDLATSRRQAPAFARIAGCPSTIFSDEATAKCWRTRNSATLSCVAFSLSSPESPGRTASFHPRVSGSRRRTPHLSTGEKLTPRSEHAESNHQAKHERIDRKVAPLIMDCFIMAVAHAHETDSGDIHDDHRGAGQRRPYEIHGRPPVLGPLGNTDPAQEGERHVG